VSNQVTHTVTGLSYGVGLAFDAASDDLYVVSGGTTGSVSVYEVARLSLTSTVPAGSVRSF
jgi:DNA-binding beta-propeller fold protein YncE